MVESFGVEQDVAPTHAFRVTVETKGFERGETSVQRVRMVVPPSDPTYGLEGSRGCWCELRDRSDRVLYRRFMHESLRSVEVPSGDPARPLMRIDAKEPAGVVVLLVPDLDQAHRLCFATVP
ncbi:MAG: hypothetical protein R3C19_27365 [Planctomycetaceae bacterium]